MTTLTVPARPGQDTSLRPVPWRRMAWVTWRQHRLALAGVAALFGVAAVYVRISGLQDAPCVCRRDRLPPGRSARLPAADLTTASMACTRPAWRMLRALQVIPALIGAFAGAPVLARELETGTFRYAWTQGFGRARWTVAKLVPLAVAVTVAAGAFSVLFSWYYQPHFGTGNRPVNLSEPAVSHHLRLTGGHARRLDAGRVRDRRPGRHPHPPGHPRDVRHLCRLHRARLRGRDWCASTT